MHANMSYHACLHVAKAAPLPSLVNFVTLPRLMEKREVDAMRLDDWDVQVWMTMMTQYHTRQVFALSLLSDC